MSSSQVLITGGAGFIGSHVSERFARAGWRVRVLDDLSSGFRHNLGEDWEFVEANVIDAAAVRAAIAGCDAVVHLAAFISVPESFERHEHCFRTNVDGTHNILQACVTHGVGKLVFASSSAVYPEAPGQAQLETDCPGPLSPYGISKLEGEHLLGIFREAHGLASCALRLFNVYGPRQRADSAYAAAVPIFMERGLKGEPLTIFGDGHQTRDFVFVGDVADAVFQATESEQSGLFNVGTAHETQLIELADSIVRVTGGVEEHDFQPPRAGDARASCADAHAIREALGWTPAHTLEQGLAATLDWYREKLTIR